MRPEAPHELRSSTRAHRADANPHGTRFVAGGTKAAGNAKLALLASLVAILCVACQERYPTMDDLDVLTVEGTPIQFFREKPGLNGVYRDARGQGVLTLQDDCLRLKENGPVIIWPVGFTPPQQQWGCRGPGRPGTGSRQGRRTHRNPGWSNRQRYWWLLRPHIGYGAAIA